ncbi:SRPBCC family protein [Mycobacterium asiaticum]|uniref:Polyketide cyclase n=1 Tax=Mycobacterium asiaticum TaxID=1790 RepID=A0A1A3C0N0_MYCAS|nr:SRPBCC family protein [Mycobacterium asiaticum]OBI80183.1 polyketide cyclase [Mycobacterium asiaticum]
MTQKRMAATTTVNAPADVIFGVLADPGTHAAIDGTGWVREPVDAPLLTAPGQIFRMAMYHDDHPNKHYEMVNRVVVFDPPSAIAWEPGQDAATPGTVLKSASGECLAFGGWIWRYDLEAVDPSTTEVVLSYDWSAVPPEYRDIEFPPFEREHLDNSLRNLARLAVRAASASAVPAS